MQTVCCTVWACSLLIRGVHAIGCVAGRLLRHPHVCGAISMCAYLCSIAQSPLDLLRNRDGHRPKYTCACMLPATLHKPRAHVDIQLQCMPDKQFWQRSRKMPIPAWHRHRTPAGTLVESQCERSQCSCTLCCALSLCAWQRVSSKVVEILVTATLIVMQHASSAVLLPCYTNHSNSVRLRRMVAVCPLDAVSQFWLAQA